MSGYKESICRSSAHCTTIVYLGQIKISKIRITRRRSTLWSNRNTMPPLSLRQLESLLQICTSLYLVRTPE
jgi:hypothetical protein